MEHLLSAFSGLGIDNAAVVVDGPEVPVVDGSAMPFVSALINAGIRRWALAPRPAGRSSPSGTHPAGRAGRALPDHTPRITVSIDFTSRTSACNA